MNSPFFLVNKFWPCILCQITRNYTQTGHSLVIFFYQYYMYLGKFIIMAYIFLVKQAVSVTFCVFLFLDVNECLAAGRAGCQHTCFNTRGSYSCSCEPGYRLHNDRHRCIPTDPNLNNCAPGFRSNPATGACEGRSHCNTIDQGLYLNRL